MSYTTTKGNATISIDTDLQELYTGFFAKVAPNAKKIIDGTLEEIERQAKKDWPVRKPQVRRDRDGKVLFFRKTSRGSYKRFERGYRINADGSFEGYLRNNAPYAWAIKYGIDSEDAQGRDIIQPTGKRVSQITMISPQRKAARKVVQALADDLMKRI